MTYYVDSTKTSSFNSGFFIKKSLVDSYLLNKNNNIFAIGGDNSSGQLGTGGLTSISSPVQLLAMANLQDIFSNGPSNVALSYGKGTYAWGNNPRGILGDGSITAKSSPISIGNITINWRVISIGTTHGAGIRTNGTLWTWGDATSGALGKGSSTVHYSSPVQVGSATNWTDVSCGDAFTIAINSSNQAFAWGKNDYGQLCLGDTTSRSSPVQITFANLLWRDVSCGANHFLAKVSWNAGEYCLTGCGRGSYGQLGGSSILSVSSPVQVGGSNNLVHWFCAMNNNSFYIKESTRLLMGLGSNESGQLGVGDITMRSSPVQIGSLTDWSHGYRNCAPLGGAVTIKMVKTDGTLWVWGYNLQGQLGLGDTNPRSSPVQVGSLNNWVNVSYNNALFLL